MKTTVSFDQGVQIALSYILAHPEQQKPDPDFDAFTDKVDAAMRAAKEMV